MRISVAMAARNAEEYIDGLLESLARQTLPPAELVVFDDASEDTTVERIDAFAAGAPFPVRIERAPARRGHVEAFLRAAALCGEDLVAFCDHDDVWLDQKLETCAAVFERDHDVSLVVHKVRVVDAELRELRPSWPPLGATRTIPPLGLTGMHVDAPGMAMVFRRELLELGDSARRPPSRYAPFDQMVHDEWLLFVGGVIGSIRILDEPLVLYRQHGSNETGCFDRERQVTLVPALEDYRAVAENAAACARYLEAVDVTEPGSAARVVAGVRHYRVLAEHWGLRTELYRSPRRLERARLLSRLLAARAYGARDPGGFGRRALGKDLVAGVALGFGRGA